MNAEQKLLRDIVVVMCGHEHADNPLFHARAEQVIALTRPAPTEAEVEAIPVLDLLRTGKDGRKFDCIESRAGTMVNVMAFFSEAD